MAVLFKFTPFLQKFQLQIEKLRKKIAIEIAQWHDLKKSPTTMC